MEAGNRETKPKEVVKINNSVLINNYTEPNTNNSNYNTNDDDGKGTGTGKGNGKGKNKDKSKSKGDGTIKGKGDDTGKGSNNDSSGDDNNNNDDGDGDNNQNNGDDNNNNDDGDGDNNQNNGDDSKSCDDVIEQGIIKSHHINCNDKKTWEKKYKWKSAYECYKSRIKKIYEDYKMSGKILGNIKPEQYKGFLESLEEKVEIMKSHGITSNLDQYIRPLTCKINSKDPTRKILKKKPIYILKKKAINIIKDDFHNKLLAFKIFVFTFLFFTMFINQEMDFGKAGSLLANPNDSKKKYIIQSIGMIAIFGVVAIFPYLQVNYGITSWKSDDYKNHIGLLISSFLIGGSLLANSIYSYATFDSLTTNQKNFIYESYVVAVGGFFPFLVMYLIRKDAWTGGYDMIFKLSIVIFAMYIINLALQFGGFYSLALTETDNRLKYNIRVLSEKDDKEEREQREREKEHFTDKPLPTSSFMGGMPNTTLQTAQYIQSVLQKMEALTVDQIRTKFPTITLDQAKLLVKMKEDLAQLSTDNITLVFLTKPSIPIDKLNKILVAYTPQELTLIQPVFSMFTLQPTASGMTIGTQQPSTIESNNKDSDIINKIKSEDGLGVSLTRPKTVLQHSISGWWLAGGGAIALIMAIYAYSTSKSLNIKPIYKWSNFDDDGLVMNKALHGGTLICETLLFAAGAALPYLYAVKNRTGDIGGSALLETSLLFFKFSCLHLILQYTGFYEHMGL
jgi:hypothetical protein